MTKKLLRTSAIAALGLGLLALGTQPAHADHVHFRVLGNGQCVLLAPDGGEQDVTLPHADAFAENRRHPLHVNVHLGQPGEVGTVMVAYANGALTADGQTHWGGTFVNR